MAKAQSVSLAQLDSMVNDAAKLAAKRLELTTLKKGNLVVRWDLVGRQIRDLATAQKFSNDVARQLNKAGMDVKPAISIINKQIIAGYIPVNRLSPAIKLTH